jgi:EAL domain-containing protein (putative c-di-GMP-specific phosphodiesterase class I)/GGDEF domain-containing protein
MYITKDKFLKSLKQIEKDDTVYLIEINNYYSLHDALGILAVDQFTDFINQAIFSFIKQSSFMGRMARINDAIVALHMKNNKDIAASEEFAIRICELFDQLEYLHEGTKLNFSANIGVICCDEDKMDISTMLAKVEDSCRRARMLKGNAYVMHGDPSSSLVVDTELGKAVFNALKGGHIKPLYQALVVVSDAAQKDKRGLYQARSVILDSNNKVIEPKEFLPVLKKTNTLKTLDRWIIRSSMEEVARLSAQGNNKFGVLIPFSYALFDDKILADWIDSLAESLKIPDPGNTMIFEVTANDFMNNTHLAKLQFSQLRDKFNIALALANVTDSEILEKCLQLEKFNYIMFSPEYTAEGTMSQEQIQAIIKMAKKHGALTVASKIGTGQYMMISANAGVDYVIGYFIQPQLEHITLSETVEII